MVAVTANTFPARQPAAAPAPKLLARIFRAVAAARQRKSDADIAEILARRGGIMALRAGRDASCAYPFHVLPALRSR